MLPRAFVTLGCLFQPPPPNPKAWSYRVASNLWIDRVRRVRELAVADQAAAPPGDSFATPEGEPEMAALMNSTPKVVFSRALTETPWGPATVIGDDIAGRVSGLKQKPGKDLFLFAGATLAQSFMPLDLIDEYRLLIHSIVLGSRRSSAFSRLHLDGRRVESY